jgi:hypothetical protein
MVTAAEFVYGRGRFDWENNFRHDGGKGRGNRSTAYRQTNIVKSQTSRIPA